MEELSFIQKVVAVIMGLGICTIVLALLMGFLLQLMDCLFVISSGLCGMASFFGRIFHFTRAPAKP